MERIIECVPNFSEGRNKEVIDAIVASIEKAGGVKYWMLIRERRLHIRSRLCSFSVTSQIISVVGYGCDREFSARPLKKKKVHSRISPRNTPSAF